MSKVFITGSADGLGLFSAQLLKSQGHEVVLHARTDERAKDVLKIMDGCRVLVGDLSNLSEIISLADQVNALGKFDAVIHNAGVYQTSSKQTFTVNTLAPYVLTSLIQVPPRLVYLSSGMHLSGHAKLDRFAADASGISYSDTKLHVLMLSMAVAQRWPAVYSNAVDPGWVPTRMGGAGAPDDLQKGYETQSWLAVSEDSKAKVSGRYFHHKQVRRHNPEADNIQLVNEFINACEQVSGIALPTN